MDGLSEPGSLAGVIEVATVGDCLARAAKDRPDNDALVFPDGRATYRELDTRVDQLARSLLGLGVGHGEKVAIALPQNLDNLAMFLAATRVGAIAVPINTRFKPHELRHVLADCGASALVVGEGPDMLRSLVEALPDLAASTGPELAVAGAPALRHVVHLGDGPRLPGAVPGDGFEAAGRVVTERQFADRRYRVRVRDVAAIMYTSGTTAAPKGAMLTHEALVREGMMTARTRLRLTEQDRVWSVLPFFHIGGITFATACFAARASYIHAGTFSPASALSQLAEQRCTVALAGFETIWLPVLKHPDFPGSELSALRLVFCLGIPERMRDMQSMLPQAPLVSGYGSTETCSFITLSDPGDPVETRMLTAGRVLPGLEVKVVDIHTGAELPPGQVGELLCRGWSRFEGYHGDPALTAQAIDPDGWFHSGDLGTIDEQGRVTWTSRLKDMMKVGGENVAALEIEDFLLRHPAVRMAQVVAAPDSYYTEVPAAFVMLAPGAAVTEQEIIDHCLGRIATFKVPRYVRFVDEWPMSGTKIQKYVLRERIQRELAERSITEAPRLSSTGRTK